MQIQCQTTSLHGQSKPSPLPHAVPLLWCRQGNTPNLLIWINYLPVVLSVQHEGSVTSNFDVHDLKTVILRLMYVIRKLVFVFENLNII